MTGKTVVSNKKDRTVKTDHKQTVITTTGIHLARRIGEALSRAYNGSYSFNYLDGEDYIEVNWQR
jgi:hypothetical protein